MTDQTNLPTDLGQVNAETHVPAQDDSVLAVRRRLLMGGLAAAPVMMTLASRPALAETPQLCKAPSGFLSGNVSQHGQDIWCQGLSPGYWKQCQHFAVGNSAGYYWKFYYPINGYDPNDPATNSKLGTADSCYSGTTPAAIASRGKKGAATPAVPSPSITATKFHSTATGFLAGPYANYGNQTMLDLLNANGSVLGRLVVATLLNVQYPALIPTSVLTKAKLVGMWNEFAAKGYYEPVAGVKWYEADIKAYLGTTQHV